MRNYKSKNLAALLAFFGGIVGLHRFYLGQNGRGFLMILLSIFSLGIVSSIIGIVDCIAFLMMNDGRFDFKYNNPDEIVRRSPRYRSYDRKYQQSHEFSGNGSSPYRKDRRINKSEFQHQTRRKDSHSQKPNVKSTKKSRPGSSKSRKNVLKTINSLKDSGIEKFKDYDIEGSIRDFKKILELDPYHIAAHFNLACAFSQLEKPQKSMHHIHRAVKAGFNDFDRIKTHEKLAFARIQPEWEDFSQNGFVFVVEKEDTIEEDTTENQTVVYEEEGSEKQEEQVELPNDPSVDLLAHLKTLKEQRERGIITEVEFEIERKKLMSS